MNILNSCTNKKIGLKIKFERQKNNMSQETLAVLSDISTTGLGNIERGTNSPTIETLDKIAHALNISLSELVDITKVDL